MKMDQEQLSKIVEKAVSDAFLQKHTFISNGIAEGVDWTDGPERAAAQMSVNAIKVSMRLSVQMVLNVLYETEVLEIPERMEEVPHLLVIRGGADS